MIIKLFKRLGRLLVMYLILNIVCFTTAKILLNHTNRLSYYRSIMDDLSMIASAISDEGISPNDTTEILQKYQTNDIRVANLKYFFRKYNSPLYDIAHVFVEKADEYTFDYRLLPAIAMQESNLCKYIPDNSHNCWGWGIYGNKVTRFNSYEEAIDTISRGIKKNYIDQGLTTPEEIMSKYTPPSTGSWANGVNTFLKVIE